MKPDQASEFYSAYLEGELDPGMKAELDRLIEENPQVALDLAEVAAAREDLEFLRDVPVEVPVDLHERIMRKVDRNRYEVEQKRSESWFSRWRLQLLGGVAAVALIGTLFTMNRGGEGFQAGSVPTNATRPSAKFDVHVQAGVPTVMFTSPQADQVVVSRQPDGVVLNETKVDGGREARFPLKNTGESALVYAITAKNATGQVFVAVPGSSSTVEPKAEGSLVDLCRAMANHFFMPVQLNSSRPERSVQWEFRGTEVMQTKLSGVKLSIDLHEGLIRLRD